MYVYFFCPANPRDELYYHKCNTFQLLEGAIHFHYDDEKPEDSLDMKNLYITCVSMKPLHENPDNDPELLFTPLSFIIKNQETCTENLEDADAPDSGASGITTSVVEESGSNLAHTRYFYEEPNL